jgi:hypothetical protein
MVHLRGASTNSSRCEAAYACPSRLYKCGCITLHDVAWMAEGDGVKVLM